MKKIIIILFIALGFWACNNENQTPKPRGYFRITLPQRNYQVFDSVSFPYQFQYPTYSFINTKNITNKETYWINIEYPNFRGTVYCSYKKINNNLATLINDSHEFVAKHITKSNAIKDKVIMEPSKNKYGLIFELSGSETASPYQFYITDSTTHFFRGALYFNNKPNNDSLQPVIDFIKTDMEHLIETFQWK